MSEPASERPAQERQNADRRAEPGATRRTPKPNRWARWAGIAWRDVAIVVACIAAIIAAVRLVNPIFSNQPTVAASITRKLPIAKAALKAPADTSRLARILASPQFEKDRQAFAADLVKTGRM